MGQCLPKQRTDEARYLAHHLKHGLHEQWSSCQCYSSKKGWHTEFGNILSFASSCLYMGFICSYFVTFTFFAWFLCSVIKPPCFLNVLDYYGNTLRALSLEKMRLPLLFYSRIVTLYFQDVVPARVKNITATWIQLFWSPWEWETCSYYDIISILRASESFWW